MCQVTVGVLGDICRAVEDGIYPYCDALMQTLLTNLQSGEVHRNIKPQILSAFGDIALAIGDRFEVGGAGAGGAAGGGAVALLWECTAVGVCCCGRHCRDALCCNGQCRLCRGRRGPVHALPPAEQYLTQSGLAHVVSTCPPPPPLALLVVLPFLPACRSTCSTWWACCRARCS